MKVIEITSQIILILPQASVEDAYSPPIDRSTAMIFRVFSSLLDENTAWFALNERLCGKLASTPISRKSDVFCISKRNQARKNGRTSRREW